MNICCCSLAGTKACENCSNNQSISNELNNISLKTLTETDWMHETKKLNETQNIKAIIKDVD